MMISCSGPLAFFAGHLATDQAAEIPRRRPAKLNKNNILFNKGIFSCTFFNPALSAAL
jgi:hypothetical protein